ncbi:hypothetical protein AGOR_G00173660 [Albula goreensis]|uniref:Uncharacterized protein n=1 Tax=Albula goreensis TaxID=1534307 RepID=A0A8T3CUJ5_9TELE|nr:hypothetical protein AGOR_G00173660 [Albula goreensis]
MHSLETADSGWYWCAIEKNWADEKVAVYITVTPVTNMTTSSNQRVTNDAVSRDSTGYHYEIPETYSDSEDTRAHLPITLVICGMVFLLLVAVLTLQIKRHGKEEGKNETRNVQPQEQQRTEANTESDQYATISLQKNRKEKKGTELPTEDVQYADISFGRTTEKDTEADHAEDSITYSLVHYHMKPENHSSEN